MTAGHGADGPWGHSGRPPRVGRRGWKGPADQGQPRDPAGLGWHL